MTAEQDLAKLLVVAIHALGGELKVSRALLDNLAPHLVVYDASDPAMLVVKTMKNQVLVGKVDNDVVDVVL